MVDEDRDAKAAQEISEVFRGTAGDAPSLKEAGTVRGIQAAAIPAFVAGEELADLADSDERIVVLTADLAKWNDVPPFAQRFPRPGPTGWDGRAVGQSL